MQKKQWIQFGGLLTLILILAGVYIGIQSYQKDQEDEKARQEEAAMITLTAFQPESVTAIQYDYNGTDYAFEKTEDIWMNKEDSEAKIDQDAFISFLESVGSIQSDTQVQAEENVDYGFDEPSRTVEITTSNGTSSLSFGMKNGMLNKYYVKTSESEKIYLVEESVYAIFDKTADDFADVSTDTDTDMNADIHTNSDMD